MQSEFSRSQEYRKNMVLALQSTTRSAIGNPVKSLTQIQIVREAAKNLIFFSGPATKREGGEGRAWPLRKKTVSKL